MYLNKKILIFLILLCVAINCHALFGMGAAREQNKMLEDAREAYQREEYSLVIDIMDDFLLKESSKKRLKEAYFLIGDSYKMLGAYDKAMLRYGEAIEFFPKDIDLNLALGDIYSYGGMTEKAVQIYQKILSIDPKNKLARLSLARAYLADGFFTRASKYFKEYLDISGDENALVFYDYALSFFMANDYDNAFQYAFKADSLKPTARTKLLIAKIYKTKGQDQKAFETIKEAGAQPDAGDEVHLTRALWLAYDGGQKESMEIADYYLKKDPSNRLALFIKYFALYRLGRENEGRQYLQRIAAQDTNNGFIENIARKILKDQPLTKTSNLKI